MIALLPLDLAGQFKSPTRLCDTLAERPLDLRV
jgi:hypothetical protein